MYSFNKWILQNPYRIRVLYFVTVLVFFTESSFINLRFYFQAGFILLVYCLWCRPFFKLMNYDLKKRARLGEGVHPIDQDYWTKVLLLNGGWLFLLIPLKLGVIDGLALLSSSAQHSRGDSMMGWKVFFFLIVASLIFYTTARSLKSKCSHISKVMTWSLLKNFLVLFIIPIGVVLFIPFFILLFYYF